MKTMPAIETRDVSKSFDSTPVLKDVSLTVNDGEFFGLFGPNGAGKTTLLRVLTGQLEQDEGTVVTAGVPNTEPIRLKHRVGIVPEAETPPTFLTAQETLELTCRIRGLDDIQGRIDRWIRFFDIEEKKDILCRDLSKGERQKVMLAAAFIHEPELLLLDEPFINLDPIYQRRVREYLQGVASEGRTVFMCTHILEIAERLCDTVAVIHQGRIVEQGRLAEISRGGDLEEVFLRAVEGGAVA
jgi:ABC-2 type transport system ATP-binding protein